MGPEVLLVDVGPTTAHPLYATNATDRYVSSQVHARLFEPEGDSFSAEVVAGWSVAEGALLLTLAQRRWSDGAPFVAADVCATVARVGDLSRPVAATGLVRAVVSGCEVVDAAHVRLPLRRPIVDPRAWLVIPVLPAHRPDWVDWVPGSAPEPEPVGLGPATIARERRGWSLAGPNPVRIEVVEDPVAAFVAGRGTRVFVDPARLGVVRGVDGVTITRWGPSTTWVLALDPLRDPYDDADLRQSLDQGIDRVAFAAAWLGRDPTLERQPWTPALAGEWPPVRPEARQAAQAATGRMVSPVGVPDAALAELPGMQLRLVDERSWVLSVLAGGHAGTSTAALVPLEGPWCAWFESRVGTAGPYNVFGFSDPEVDRLCRRIDEGDPEAPWRLTGVLTDRRAAIFLLTTQPRLASRRR